MEIKQFAEAVLATVREKADGKFNAWIVESEKNDGVRLTGITTEVLCSGQEPCFYLDGYYRAFQNGSMNVNETADIVYDHIMECQKNIPDISLKDLLKWESIKGFIYPKLVNTGMNREQLGKIPHRNFMDLSVVYYIKVTADGKGIGTIPIHNGYMELWYQDENTLYEVSLKNMSEPGSILFEDMLSFIPQWLLPDFDKASDRLKIYVLTNSDKCFGASEILKSAVMEEISQKIGDFIVLPSSVHEVLVIPERNSAEDYSSLASMVREINQQAVSPEERLSDHVYTYSRHNRELKVAA